MYLFTNKKLRPCSYNNMAKTRAMLLYEHGFPKCTPFEIQGREADFIFNARA